MKSINIPENIKNKTLEELKIEISEAIFELEIEKDLKNSINKYQRLIQLNNFIENKFKEKAKSITSKTSEILSKIQKK
jgi:DNA-binding SARP family transcriptional activator|tara:strand:+ start:281 stop:514 length:234 start_codon:yes stop_codon:yes gene_type:complete